MSPNREVWAKEWQRLFELKLRLNCPLIGVLIRVSATMESCSRGGLATRLHMPAWQWSDERAFRLQFRCGFCSLSGSLSFDLIVTKKINDIEYMPVYLICKKFQVKSTAVDVARGKRWRLQIRWRHSKYYRSPLSVHYHSMCGHIQVTDRIWLLRRATNHVCKNARQCMRRAGILSLGVTGFKMAKTAISTRTWRILLIFSRGREV